MLPLQISVNRDQEAHARGMDPSNGSVYKYRRGETLGFFVLPPRPISSTDFDVQSSQSIFLTNFLQSTPRSTTCVCFPSLELCFPPWPRRMPLMCLASQDCPIPTNASKITATAMEWFLPAKRGLPARRRVSAPQYVLIAESEFNDYHNANLHSDTMATHV